MTANLRKSVRLLLIASLALNLFVVGAVATSWIAGHGWSFGLGAERQRVRLIGLPSPRQLRAILPERDHPALEALRDQHRPEIRPRLRALIEAREQVAAAVRAEPLDRPALEAALAHLRETEIVAAGSVHEMFADLMERLDPESRAKVADTLVRRRRK